MPSIHSIAVIGATGMLGRPVTEELIRAGFQVRVLARHPDSVRPLFPEAEVVRGDLADEKSLLAGLQGQDAVYLNLSIRQPEKETAFHTESDGLQNLLNAARFAGIRRIGYLSSLVMRYQGMNGFHWWAFDVKQAAVRLIKASGIPYSLFYPSSFMETIPFQQRLGNRILLVGKSPVKLYFIAAQDYGRQVARAFQQAEEGKPQEYVIQGPEPITQDDAARQFAAHYPKARLKITTVPHWVVQAAGKLAQQAHYGAHITEALNKYPETFEAERSWQELGKPETTIREFARQCP
ncbi:SDR family oxidoreductase [Larkinella soli]|uniref:SDR family oxidoreductase n=1 Tax=Larkinella soli TaxID=1770527 RepID=UPI000FFB974B|nr:NAD(P)H-binding protein [Larkinella soli]